MTEARVERIVLRPGSTVRPDSVILELSNPVLEQAFQDRLATAGPLVLFIDALDQLSASDPARNWAINSDISSSSSKWHSRTKASSAKMRPCVLYRMRERV